MKFDSRILIVLAGIVMIALASKMLGGCGNHSIQGDSIRDSLIKSVVTARAEAESTKSRARERIASDSIKWRIYAIESISKARASIRDSAQLAMNRAVDRARHQVEKAYGDSSNLFSSHPDDTICRVWSTCADESIRSIGDSLLRSRLDSSRFASEAQGKSCSAALSTERLKAYQPSPSKEKSSWGGIFWSFLLGIFGFLGGWAL